MDNFTKNIIFIDFMSHFIFKNGFVRLEKQLTN